MTETWRDAVRWLSSWLPMTRDDDRPVDSFRGAFIPDVARSILLRTTKPGDWVWDPFAGSGTTGLVAKELGRECLLSDLNPVRDDILPLNAMDGTVVRVQIQGYPMIKNFMGRQNDDGLFQFDTVILHPPYYNVVAFGDHEKHIPGDLSRCTELDHFYNLWYLVCANIARHVKPGGHVVLVCGDIWVTGEARVEPLAFRCMETILQTLPKSKLKAKQVKNIVGNQAFERRKNFMLSRFYRWKSVRFAHEEIYTVQRGK